MSEGPLGGLTDWATDLIEATGYPGITVLVALTNVLPPVPAELVLMVAGFVSGEGQLWFPAVVAAATVGSLGGALALYASGYWLGEERLRRFVKRFGRFLLLKEADLDRANHWFDRHGRMAVLFGRMVPGLRKVVPIPAGVARMPLKWFLTYIVIGNLFSNSVLVGLGWVLGDQWVVVRRYTHLLEYGVLIALAAAVLWFVWNRWSARGR